VGISAAPAPSAPSDFPDVGDFSCATIVRQSLDALEKYTQKFDADIQSTSSPSERAVQLEAHRHRLGGWVNDAKDLQTGDLRMRHECAQRFRLALRAAHHEADPAAAEVTIRRLMAEVQIFFARQITQLPEGEQADVTTKVASALKTFADDAVGLSQERPRVAAAATTPAVNSKAQIDIVGRANVSAAAALAPRTKPSRGTAQSAVSDFSDIAQTLSIMGSPAPLLHFDRTVAAKLGSEIGDLIHALPTAGALDAVAREKDSWPASVRKALDPALITLQTDADALLAVANADEAAPLTQAGKAALAKVSDDLTALVGGALPQLTAYLDIILKKPGAAKASAALKDFLDFASQAQKQIAADPFKGAVAAFKQDDSQETTAGDKARVLSDVSNIFTDLNDLASAGKPLDVNDVAGDIRDHLADIRSLMADLGIATKDQDSITRKLLAEVAPKWESLTKKIADVVTAGQRIAPTAQAALDAQAAAKKTPRDRALAKKLMLANAARDKANVVANRALGGFIDDMDNLFSTDLMLIAGRLRDSHKPLGPKGQTLVELFADGMSATLANADFKNALKTIKNEGMSPVTRSALALAMFIGVLIVIAIACFFYAGQLAGGLFAGSTIPPTAFKGAWDLWKQYSDSDYYKQMLADKKWAAFCTITKKLNDAAASAAG
jgi:hypothetical protein